MAQEREIQADFGREAALSSGSSFRFLQGRNDLPNVDRRFPGLVSWKRTKVDPWGAFIFLALANQWLRALVQILQVVAALV